MTFTGGAQSNTIEILYDATGTKLRKTVKTGTTTNYTQDYLGGIEYRDGVREAIYHAEGRVFNDAGINKYEYSIRDHLGNTRLTFRDKNANGVVDVSPEANEVVQENHYYPFGLNTEGPWMNDAAIDNKYQYNGKEWNNDFGLNWNDYGARWYDAAIGKWHAVDPLTVKYQNWSPYNYALNNPIIYVDPDGRDAILAIRSGQNGNNGTINVRLVFNSPSRINADAKQAAIASFSKTWGNGGASEGGNNTFVGKTFESIDVGGQQYNVTYQWEFNEESDANSHPAPGENWLTFTEDREKTSNYGGGNLEYKASQEKDPAKKGTTFGHELSHVMGIGNNTYKDENGTMSISS